MKTWIFALSLLLSARAHAQPAPLSPQQLREALARYRREPSVDDIVHAVLAQPAFDPSRIADGIFRARTAGLLPQVRGDVRRGQVIDLGALQSSTADRSSWSTGDELSFGGSLTFGLDRLLYAPEEAGLFREQRQIEERRHELITRVIHIYFERRRLQLERDISGSADIASEMRILELEAMLDSLSGGAFSRMMSRPP